MPAFARLDSSDAQFVDIIHSNGVATILQGGKPSSDLHLKFLYFSIEWINRFRIDSTHWTRRLLPQQRNGPARMQSDVHHAHQHYDRHPRLLGRLQPHAIHSAVHRFTDSFLPVRRIRMHQLCQFQTSNFHSFIY